MKKFFSLPRFLFALFGVALASCVASVPLMVFERGDGHSMYFVKPQRFNGLSGCQYVEVDWTIHAGRDGVGTVVMNYSVYADRPVRSVDSLRFVSSTFEGAWAPGGERLFIEPIRKGFLSRWSVGISAEGVQKLFSSTRIRLELAGDELMVAEGNRATIRTFKTLRLKLLPLFR